MDIVKIRADLKLFENRRQYRSINEERRESQFLEKILKLDKPLAKLEKKTKKMQITNIKNKIENITIDTSGIKIITRKYYEQLYTSGFDTRKK